MHKETNIVLSRAHGHDTGEQVPDGRGCREALSGGLWLAERDAHLGGGRYLIKPAFVEFISS